MKSAGKARNNGLYRHIRTSKEIIRNLLNDSFNNEGKIITTVGGNTKSLKTWSDVVRMLNNNGGFSSLPILR